LEKTSNEDPYLIQNPYEDVWSSALLNVKKDIHSLHAFFNEFEEWAFDSQGAVREGRNLAVYPKRESLSLGFLTVLKTLAVDSLSSFDLDFLERVVKADWQMSCLLRWLALANTQFSVSAWSIWYFLNP
jgi:hypothetical protein